MKKRKVSSQTTSQDVKIQDSQSTDIAAGIETIFVSPKNTPSCKDKSDLSSFADISHKNTSGANNWQTFLRLNQQKLINGLSKPNLVMTNGPLQSNDIPPTNTVASTKENKIGKKTKAISKSTKVDRNNKTFLNDDEVKSVPEVRSGKPKKQFDQKPALTKCIAMDCEMVGVEVGVNNSMVARVSMVNANGDCIYDKYVKPTEPVLDFRTHVSGIRPKDLENATDFKTVQKEVSAILTGRILVGHALHNDLRVLFLSHPYMSRRDTATFKRFRGGPIPSLKSLAEKYLGVTIQDGEHNSVQDALAAMQLYKMFKTEWESSFVKKKSKLTNQKLKSASAKKKSKSTSKNQKSKSASTNQKALSTSLSINAMDV